jgi:hypothetical protein
MSFVSVQFLFSGSLDTAAFVTLYFDLIMSFFSETDCIILIRFSVGIVISL